MSGSKEALSRKAIILIMIRVGGVMFLFGLTWIFAILTFSVPGLRETFQILFTVFNSFQGFFIFLFLCVFNKDAQESWRGTFVGRKVSHLFYSDSSNYSSGNLTSKRSVPPQENLSFGTNNVSLENSHESSTRHKASSLVIANNLPSENLDGTFELSQLKENTNKATTTTELALDQTNPEKDETDVDVSKSKPELKIKIRRFSTKNEGKHHVEEMEVELYSDSDTESK